MELLILNSPGLSYKFRNNGTQTLELNSSGNATFTGNVGIGAAASDGNLHVRKTGINTGITNVLMNANFADGSNGTGLSIGYRTDETTAVLAARTATGNIAFYSYDGGWSESMRISNTGNVGIGTDSPSSTLDVRGSGEWYDAGIIVRRDAAPTQFGTISQYNGSLNLISVVGGGGGNGEIMFSNHNAATGTPTERMRIDSSGNVGIGTTNPGAQLELKKETTWGTLDNQVIYINNTGTGGNTGALHDMGSITWRSGNVNTAAISGIRNTPGSGNNVDLRFTTATQSGGQQTSMTILSGGNVGIGTTSPSSKLQVGDGTTNVNVKVFGSATSGIQIHTASGNIASLEQYFGDEGSLWLRKGATTKVLVRADGDSYFNGGNVGIGLTSPVNKLGIEVAANSNTKAINIYSKNTSPNSYTSIGSQYSISNTYVESEIRFGNETQNGGGSYLGFVAGGTNSGNTEKMRITSGGYVAIPNDSGSFSGAASLILTKKSSVPYIQYQYSGTSTSFRLEMDEYVTAGNVRQYFTQTNGGVSNGFSMTFNTGSVIFGDLEVASATQNSGSAFKKDSKARMTLCQASNSTALTDLQEYFNPNGAVGKIQTSGSATLFTTSSDYRLKEDLKSFSGLEVISKIPVYDFKWKISDERGYGVMAHELQEVLPQAVGGDKDYEKKHVVKKAEYDDDHNLIKDAEYGMRPSYQTVDYSKIVPLLVKSIQELKAENDSLKARIETLENK